MKQFLTFVKKEFLHVLRDKKTLLILFGMPVVQILIFGFALTNEVKNSQIVVVDYAKDIASQEIITKIEASRYFEIRKTLAGSKELEAAFRTGEIKMAVIFPEGFNNQLLHQNKAQIQVLADASDPNNATTLTNYVTSIINDYQAQLNQENTVPLQIKPEVKMLYNPQLKGAPNFVPGVMALVLMLVCVMMTAIAIVKEKETGTMEILLVSPFKPLMVILSKAVPYLLLSMVNVVSILLLSVFVLDLPIAGNILLLFAESTLFIITCLTLGIFISVKTDSQQTAMLISLLGMLLPTLLFSGFMFPIENMPLPLQWFSNVVPSKWYYIIVKGIMIKGLGFSYVWKETLILFGITIFLLIISLKSFKIRLS
ncbi:ABC-2 type transport system permease protein [Flavobacterium sp. CF108]|uniref:ABC transporter permease n=1 Tax=unclassified Flavobacterium TaxID=196869 RepID=UPI0008C93AB7|nr:MULTISPECIES: ABC transporter permease [unclassified Flavobacterium]SEN90659.1 ABC-2 type transport system permease protein [Flavobacterium sp. fv08]SHH25348.1 ABC-2 type transport system permease protein [Flavobacterium sp. CF108]